MPCRPERGSVLAAELLLAAAVVVAVASIAAAVVRVEDALEADRFGARSSAVVAARHGDPEALGTVPLRPGAHFTVASGDTAAVSVGGSLDLPHPAGSKRVEISTAAEVPVAPYRSNRG